jgi:hypothetical protein
VRSRALVSLDRLHHRRFLSPKNTFSADPTMRVSTTYSNVTAVLCLSERMVIGNSP